MKEKKEKGEGTHLVVTTTVRVINRVHRHTAGTRPAVPLGPKLVERATGLEHGLVDTTAAGDDADLGAAALLDGFFGARGELDAGDAGFGDLAWSEARRGE